MSAEAQSDDRGGLRATFGPTWEGARIGAMLCMPMLPGAFVFGLANGALSAQKGLDFLETFAMSGLLFAGAAQATAMELWRPGGWSLASLLAVVGVVAAVNARMFLQGASLRPWLSNAPASTIYPNLALMTDMNWSLGVSYRARGGNDIGMFISIGVISWLVWTPACMIGYELTNYVADPKRYALDLMIVVVFSALSINVFRRATRWPPFIVAGLVALLASWLLPGFWFVVIGAVAGAMAAAFAGPKDA